MRGAAARRRSACLFGDLRHRHKTVEFKRTTYNIVALKEKILTAKLPPFLAKKARERPLIAEQVWRAEEDVETNRTG